MNVKRPVKHGTPGGYQAHKRRGENACSACLLAWRMKMREYRNGVPRAVYVANCKRVASIRASKRRYKRRQREQRIADQAK